MIDPPRVRWLLEEDPDFPGPQTLREAALVDAIPLDPGPPWAPRWPSVDGPLVAYGTMRTLRRLQAHAPLAHAVFDSYPALRWSSWLPSLYDLLGREVFLVPMNALASLDLERHFGPRVFVRPETNYKLFAARVILAHQAHEFLDFHREHARELVVLSQVVDLGHEFRCFCREGEVFAHSSYPDLPYREAPDIVLAAARACARRLLEQRGLRMITVDLALSPENQVRLVEIGGVNSWGVYGSHLPSFVAAMEAEALLCWEDRGHRSPPGG
ncbi:MAG: ATP-grasp domain-containing protein [Polyangiaceae bacterium]|nr:ATP-grasp domain-containing protein [Polyangiaceae bacterium]